MRWRLLALAALVPGAAFAQLALFSLDANVHETAVGSTFDMGKVAAGSTKDIRFRARNTGPSPLPVTNFNISGAGFTLPDKPSIPYTIAPSNFLEFTIHLAAGSAATYNANLQLNSTSVLVYASVTASATLSSSVGCTGPDPALGTIDFGSVSLVPNASKSCSFTLRNSNTQTVTVSTIAVSGDSFTGPQGVKTPLTLLAGEAVNLTILFTPASPTVYNGALIIDARTYPLTAKALAAPILAPILDYQSTPLASAQQRTLTVRLPAPASVPINGNITLSFTPDPAIVKDDPAIAFAATGARSVPYSIQPGETQATLGGAPGAVFQTGTTAGRIRFSVTSNVAFQGDPTANLTIPASSISIDTASALKRTGALDVNITGFDNTYTAGSMAFTFYDTAGNPLNGVISADFTTNFKNYYSQAQAGSLFRALVTFQVTGDVSKIGSVDVRLANSAGAVNTARLAFP